jgi:hypothetical protein
MPRVANDPCRDRCYTVHEIDRLTTVVAHITFNELQRRGWKQDEADRSIQERVRTYMLGGVTADDVLAEDAAQRQARYEHDERARINYKYSVLRLGRRMLKARQESRHSRGGLP